MGFSTRKKLVCRRDRVDQGARSQFPSACDGGCGGTVREKKRNNLNRDFSVIVGRAPGRANTAGVGKRVKTIKPANQKTIPRNGRCHQKTGNYPHTVHPDSSKQVICYATYEGYVHPFRWHGDSRARRSNRSRTARRTEIADATNGRKNVSNAPHFVWRKNRVPLVRNSIVTATVLPILMAFVITPVNRKRREF